jgi:fatty acid synthase
LFAGFVEFVIMVQKGTGNFEVFEGGATVVSGTVRVPENVYDETVSLEIFEPQTGDNLLEMSSHDIYKELRLRGYNYQGDFCGLVSLDNCGECLVRNRFVHYLYKIYLICLHYHLSQQL